MFAYGARQDGNQKEIIAGLRKIGATVAILTTAGKDIPDLLVGYHGDNYLIEIKVKKGKLSAGQEEFARDWRGQTSIARSLEDALRIVGAIT